MIETTNFCFTLNDTIENYEAFLNNPNVFIKHISNACIDKDLLWKYSRIKNCTPLHDRTYSFIVEGTCKRLRKCENVITSLSERFFTIEYKNFLNYLEDKWLFEKR